MQKKDIREKQMHLNKVYFSLKRKQRSLWLRYNTKNDAKNHTKTGVKNDAV